MMDQYIIDKYIIAYINGTIELFDEKTVFSDLLKIVEKDIKLSPHNLSHMYIFNKQKYMNMTLTQIQNDIKNKNILVPILKIQKSGYNKLNLIDQLDLYYREIQLNRYIILISNYLKLSSNQKDLLKQMIISIFDKLYEEIIIKKKSKIFTNDELESFKKKSINKKVKNKDILYEFCWLNNLKDIKETTSINQMIDSIKEFYQTNINNDNKNPRSITNSPIKNKKKNRKINNCS